ncbi:16S rRNA (adenine(1408)-N(1))-methyltransferase KamB [Crossiella sp. SN42]|uniref:16S rRNA (adenine(1408)-N(1))-methyltransferase KamB n=1 Tax=Crossiella sp. SN42 TaxID=2944808 RepID=UPI00207CB382|nr:16S rRNA (adenine(1408)-N(1))-methyltransferase KamB [Crossiella sp. SN42]MCO1579370.1 16S rRNA (adenine(1408)-N(1))-methyltransferase KamB [Crossiella sp. SN42]
MRRVTGKQVVDLTAEQFAELRAQYTSVLLDVGTGDGKHPLHLARKHPDQLVIGLDAAPDNLRKTAGKAAAKPAKGGLPNLVYLWHAAESLPPELREIDELHVLMPWGSLLRGVLDTEGALLRGLAACCRPGADFLVTLNLHAWRPPVPEVGDTAEPTPESATEVLAKAYATAGWQLTEAAYLSPEEIAELATSWTRRLNSSRDQLDVLALRGTIA